VPYKESWCTVELCLPGPCRIMWSRDFSPSTQGTPPPPSGHWEFSPPPSCGSVRAAWFHPFSHSTRGPTQSCTAAPAPSPAESVRGMRWPPPAALRPAWQQTPSLAACIAAADRRACVQAVLPQPSGSRFQTHWFLHLLLPWHCNEMVLELFSFLARRFLHARDRQRLHSLHKRCTCPLMGTTPEVGPLTSSPPSQGQSSGGALWSAVYTPGDGQTSPAYSSQPVHYLYINQLLSVNKLVL
jgi:hypothetical protein